MSEVASIDADERRRRAEARLAASRPSREAAAGAHAKKILRGTQSGDGLVSKSFAEIAADHYRMSDEELERIPALTEEEIEASALADLDSPPWTEEELEQAVRRRDARLAASKSPFR